jgi:hypothetical protein
MTISRRYLNNLPNVEEIKKLAREILDSELKLDKTLQTKDSLKKETLKLEKELISPEQSLNPKKLKIVKEQMEELSNDLSKKDKEINDLKRHIFDSQSIIEDEIREGLSQLYHQSRSSLDEAQSKIKKHQKLVFEAQNNLASASRDEVDKYRHEWVQNVERLIKDEEKVKNCEIQIEAIQRVYKLEFSLK